MATSNAVASTSTQNIVPVQAAFNTDGQCLGLVGPGGAYFSPPLTGDIVNPITLQLGGNTVATAASVPTIASGFGTSPTITAVHTMGFKIVIGTGGATGGVISFPAAPNGWICYATDVTSGSSVFVQQTGTSATSATLAAFGNTTGTSASMSAGDVLLVIAIAF